MKDTLDADSCVPYWTVAYQLGRASVGLKCLDLFAKEFVRITRTSRLQEITLDMMEVALERDDLNVSSEVDVCEV